MGSNIKTLNKYIVTLRPGNFTFKMFTFDIVRETKLLYEVKSPDVGLKYVKKINIDKILKNEHIDHPLFYQRHFWGISLTEEKKKALIAEVIKEFGILESQVTEMRTLINGGITVTAK